MKKLLTFFITGFFVFSFDVYSDDHYEELPNVSNVQVNVCKLKEGVSLKEYNAVSIKRLQNNRRMHNHDIESIQNHRMSNGLRSEALSYILQELQLKEVLRYG